MICQQAVPQLQFSNSLSVEATVAIEGDYAGSPQTERPMPPDEIGNARILLNIYAYKQNW